MINRSFYDPLYGQFIFPERSIFGFVTSHRDEIEVLGEKIKDWLFDEDVFKIAMQPVGSTSLFVNVSAFYSKLEHALGVWLLAHATLRRTRVNSHSVLYKWLKDSEDNLIDEFVFASLIRGLFFTTFDELKYFFDSSEREKLFGLFFRKVKDYVTVFIQDSKVDQDKLFALLDQNDNGQICQSNKSVPIKVLKTVFFSGGILDLRFLDAVIRTAFYIGSPIGGSLFRNSAAQSDVFSTLCRFFATLNIVFDDQGDNCRVEIQDPEVLPVAKGLISTCRELGIRLSHKAMGYSTVAVSSLKNHKEQQSDFIVNGPLYYVLNGDKHKNLKEPDAVIAQGKLKQGIDRDTVINECHRLLRCSKKAQRVDVQKYRFVPKNFLRFNLETYEFNNYRDFCLQDFKDTVFIILKNVYRAKSLNKLYKIVLENGDNWFEYYSLVNK
jgi:hypothetical protein